MEPTQGIADNAATTAVDSRSRSPSSSSTTSSQESIAESAESWSNVSSSTISAHDGMRVDLVWLRSAQEQSGDWKADLPPFPYQVYFTTSASQAADDADFGAAFVSHIGDMKKVAHNRGLAEFAFNVVAQPSYHLEIYARPFPNILACIAHQRKEVRRRYALATFPSMVHSWGLVGLGYAYKGKIIVIDSNDWRTEGVLLVQFDRGLISRRRDPSARDERARKRALQWARVGVLDEPMVFARRTAGTDLPFTLKQWWMRVGQAEAEARFARRNRVSRDEDSHSPLGSDGHSDAPSIDSDTGDYLDDEPSTSGEDVGNDSLESSDDGYEDDEPDVGDGDNPSIGKISRCISISDLFKPDDELHYLAIGSYTDTLGQKVISVWDRRRSSARPHFAFTLYLSQDLLPVKPRALFNCLNWGLISNERWTLDIVSHIPSVEAALDLDMYDRPRRDSASTSKTRAIMSMILTRVVGSKLPPELRDHIQDMMGPPAVPDFSSRFTRPHQNFFMYLEQRHIREAPMLIYYSPANWHRRTPNFSSLGTSFEMKHLRFWHRVADELHILWSLCSPRTSLFTNTGLPSITLKLHFRTEAAVLTFSSHLQAELHFGESIVIPCLDAFSHNLWAHFRDIIDLETGEVVPDPPHLYYDRRGALRLPWYRDSWLQSRELGYRGRSNFQTLLPSIGTTIDNGERADFHYDFSHYFFRITRAGGVQEGRRYAFRLKFGVVLKRWTLGTAEDRRGPYNLPPIPVHMEPQGFKVISTEGGRLIIPLADVSID